MQTNPLTTEEILQLALEKETQARSFYDELANRCQIDIVRELLERLKDEEHKHMRLIVDMQMRLRLGRNPLHHAG